MRFSSAPACSQNGSNEVYTQLHRFSEHLPFLFMLGRSVCVIDCTVLRWGWPGRWAASRCGDVTSCVIVAGVWRLPAKSHARSHGPALPSSFFACCAGECMHVLSCRISFSSTDITIMYACIVVKQTTRDHEPEGCAAVQPCLVVRVCLACVLSAGCLRLSSLPVSGSHPSHTTQTDSALTSTLRPALQPGQARSHRAAGCAGAGRVATRVGPGGSR